MSQSFKDFLTAYGESNPPALAYHDRVDVHEWLPRVRAKLRELMGPVPPRVAPDACLVRTWAEADHVRHLLHVPVTAISTVPAYLLVPHDLAAGERRPALIGLGGAAMLRRRR